jgi:plastocyanin
MKSVWMALGAAVIVAAAAVACGGGSSPTTPTPAAPPTTTTPPPTTTPPATGPNPTTATITIGATGAVSPASVTIAPGGRVTFVNSHNQAHDMSSDPHPEHTQCPEINSVGFLTAGQTRTTANLNTARTCGFHDHNLPDNAGLKGRIIIQ